MRYLLAKSSPPAVEDVDGALTAAGIKLVTRYAEQWVGRRARDMSLEGQYPELRGVFFDVRHDPELAKEYVGKSFIQNLPRRLVLAKAGGPYIGPRGGKWADPEHTIAWDPSQAGGGGGAKPVEGEAKTTKPGAKPEAKPEGKAEVKPGEKPAGKAGDTASAKPPRKWVDEPPDFLGGKQTIDLHRLSKQGEPPRYHPSRKPLHEKILNTFLSDRNGRPIQPPPAGVKKSAIVMMGGPASGKTTAVKKLLGTDDFASKGFVSVNPDDVKEHIPEYRQSLNLGIDESGVPISAKSAGTVVHEESSDLAAEVKNAALERGLNMIVDGSGYNAEKHGKLIQTLQSKGYHVQLIMAHLDVDTAKKRAAERALKSGRDVPDKVIEGAYSKVPYNFDRLSKLADEFHLLDTNAPGGAAIRWSGRKGSPDIEHDPAFVRQFKQQYGSGASAGAKPAEPKAAAPVQKSMRFVLTKAFPPPKPGQPPVTPPPGQPGPPPQPAQQPPKPAMPPQPGQQVPKMTIPQGPPPQKGPPMPQPAPQQAQPGKPMATPGPTAGSPVLGQPGAQGAPTDQPGVGRAPLTVQEMMANLAATKLPDEDPQAAKPFEGTDFGGGEGIDWPYDAGPDYSPHRIRYEASPEEEAKYQKGKPKKPATGSPEKPPKTPPGKQP